MNENATLTSLAMLKVNADVEGKDYIDYLLPFVSYVLLKYQPDPVTQEKVKQFLLEEFGLSVALRVCELVLRRLKRQRCLRKENRLYYIVGDIAEPGIRERRTQAEHQLRAVVHTLVKFVSETFDLTWSKQQAEYAIVYYLSRFSIECLRMYAQGTALPKVVKSSQTDLFIVNAFIQHLKDEFSDHFDSLLVFVKGHMLANALICPDLQSLKEKFEKVTFYLDTPLILDLLGLEGDPQKAAAEELLDLVANLKGQIAIFEHTVEEVHRVIKGCEEHLNDPYARGRIIKEMRRSKKTKSDLVLIRADLDHFFSSKGIVRRDTPEYDKSFQIDEKILESALDEDIRYFNPRAIQYDINSIRSVYVLRSGKEPTKLEEAVAVLVTSNSALARVADDYGKNMESTREVSSVITDFSLANVAWLKAPLRTPELPQLQMLAVCYAAMEPREALWSKYLEEIEKLKQSGHVSADMHAMLRYSLRARAELMKLTLGSEEGFSERTVDQIIERVRENLTKEKDEELAKERAISFSVRKQAEKEYKEKAARRKYAYDGAQGCAKWVSRCVLLGFTLFLIVFVAITTFGLRSVWDQAIYIHVPISLFLCLGMIWVVLNWILGISGKDLSRKAESWVKQKLLELLWPDQGKVGISSHEPTPRDSEPGNDRHNP